MQALVASLLSLLLLASIADGWLGVYLSDKHDEAVIDEVIPNSPAANAGLKAGDVMLAVGDTVTATREQFVAAIRAGKPGDRLGIRLRRDDKEMNVVVKLGETPAEGGTKPQPKDSAPKGQKPPKPAVEPSPESKPLAPAQGGKGYLGLGVKETGDAVVVESVLADGPAKAAGVEAGDTLTSVGDQLVKGLGDLDLFLARAKPGQKVTLGLRRGEETRSVSLRLGEAPAKERKPLRAETAPAPEPTPRPDARQAVDLEAELAALREELARLRKELEELRKGKGRE